MALKGNTPGYFNPFNWTSFGRTGWTQPEGMVPAHIVEARVFNVNLANWTVDLQAIFDQKLFLDVQVGQPYVHATGGEGTYAVPEVGAKCLVLIPSDGSPPCVMAFIMPMETLPDTSTDEAPAGTASVGTEDGAKDYSFSGGRKKPKPGDIIHKGRDGNFMILHRGGVAQFGASPLAQRICVPLNNLITDVSQNYNHYNGSGSINWGIQDRGSQSPGGEYRHTQRIYANDEFADIRVAMGRVRSPVPEPTGKAGENTNLNQLKIGTDADTVFEFVLSKDGFETDAGEFRAGADDVKLRIFFDRDGNGMARFEGSVDMRVKKKLRITVDDNLDVFGKKTISVDAKDAIKLLGGSLAELGTNGGNVVINGGSKPVAFVGSRVQVAIAPPGLTATVIAPSLGPAPVPVTITAGIFEGVVISGNPTILV